MSVPTTSKDAVAAGNAAPAAQATPTQTDLRYYLLLPEARRKGDKHRAAFEPFLREAEFLFALREAESCASGRTVGWRGARMPRYR